MVRCISSDDSIGVDGATALATYLERNNTLTELSLGRKLVDVAMMDMLQLACNIGRDSTHWHDVIKCVVFSTTRL